MGEVALPSRVTGLAAISISEEITFMPGCQASSNSSQYGLEVGVDWRLILRRTDLLAMYQVFLLLRARLLFFRGELLLRSVILPRPGRNQRRIHGLELKLRLVRIGRKIGFRRLQKVLVVAVREVGFVVCAPRLVAQAGALRHNSRQLQHVIKLARK